MPAAPRARTAVALVAVPAAALGGFGLLVVASVTARPGLALGGAGHFAVRQGAALAVAVALAVVVAAAGGTRLMRAAPWLFALAAAAVAAVFLPGVGVRAAGARRWLHLGPLSGAPAPFLAWGVALLIASWGRAAPRREDDASGPSDSRLGRARRHRAAALLMGVGAVGLLVAEPDFSAAAVCGLVGLTALAGLGFGGRRLGPAALVLALLLAVVASRFSYVGGRLAGFFAPERDRRGAGYEVLALERAAAAVSIAGSGLGHGELRRRLSSPASDYVFAVVVEELGGAGGGALLAAWAVLGVGTVLTARGQQDRRRRALALSAGVALLAPAALHAAVCLGAVPIVGVSMPLVSYDPGATVAAGLDVGTLLAMVRSRALQDPRA